MHGGDGQNCVKRFKLGRPKKGSLIFEIEKKRLTRYNYSSLSKKINIFEIGSLEIYDMGGGVARGLHCIAS